jgi:hypothetical protein
MTDTTKIPFSFCRIKRAAEFLGIHTDDLLSLAVYGKIILCIRLEGMKGILYLEGKPDELDSWYRALDYDYSTVSGARNVSAHTSFSIDNISLDKHNELINNPLFYQNGVVGSIGYNSSRSHEGRAFGLWIPGTSVINSILNHGKTFTGEDTLKFYQADSSCPRGAMIPVDLEKYWRKTMEYEKYYDERYVGFELTKSDLWITSEQVRSFIAHNGDCNKMPDINKQENNCQKDLIKGKPDINHMAEYHATNREQFYKAAIHLLSKYPDECRGERKEVSPEKWRDCILAHKNEIPVLTITGEDVMLRHLRSATKRQGV